MGSLADELAEAAEGNLDKFLKDLDRSYSVKYPGFCRNKKYKTQEECEAAGSKWTTNVLPDAAMDVLNIGQNGGISSALSAELKTLSTWFRRQTAGDAPPIRSNPTLYVKKKFIEIPADTVRGLKEAEFIEVSYDELKDMALVPMDGLKKKKPPASTIKSVEFGGGCADKQYENKKDCEDNGASWNINQGDVKYIGITHKGFMKRPKALLSMEVSKLTWGKGKPIKLYFRNKINTHEYERILALAITDKNADMSDSKSAEQFLPDPMHLAQYYSPTDPASGDNLLVDMFDIIRESTRAGQKDYMLTFKAGLRDAANVFVEKTLEEEALCCIFMAFLDANPKAKEAVTWDTHKVKMWVGGVDGDWKDVTISEFLEAQQTTLRATKVMLEFLLNMMLSTAKASLEPLMFNLIAMITNMLYMAMAANLREAQSATTKMIEQWVQEEIKRQMDFAKKKIEEGAGSCSNSNYAKKTPCEDAGEVWTSSEEEWQALIAALRCLPLEQVMIMLIRSLIGQNSIFTTVAALFQRIMLYFKMKSNKTNVNLFSMSQGAKVGFGTHLIKAAIEIIDWLLALNTEGLMVCDKYDINDVSDMAGKDPYGTGTDTGAYGEKLVDCHFPDGSIQQISWYLCVKDCGLSCIPCPPFGPDGAPAVDAVMCPFGQNCDPETGTCIITCGNSSCAPPQICVNGTCQDAMIALECPGGCPEGQVCDTTTGTCITDTSGLGDGTGDEDGDGTADGTVSSGLFDSFSPLFPDHTPEEMLSDEAKMSLGYSPNKAYSERIDITGEGIDPLRLLVLKDEGEISSFFSSYLGLNPEAAAIAASNAKKGSCLGSLNKKQREHVTSLLTELGIKI